MLKDTERDTVVRVLRDNVFTPAPSPGAVLQAWIGSALAAQIPDAPSPQLRTELTVAFCEGQQWRRQGDHPLIDLISSIEPLEPSLRGIIQRLRLVPMPPNPLQAEILDNGILFLGRDDLRAMIQILETPSGPCVLRVNGEAKSGKSYSFRFLQFLRLQNRPITPVLLENPGPTTAAADVASTLISRIGRPVENPPSLVNESPLRSAQLLADWVLNSAYRALATNWWFVLDNFDDEALPEDTKEFIRQLALQIANNGLWRPRMRLILINYRAPLPRDLKRLQKEEKLSLDRQDWLRIVRSYFDRLAAGATAGKRQSVLNKRESTLVNLQNEQDANFLMALCDALEEATDEFAV